MLAMLESSFFLFYWHKKRWGGGSKEGVYPKRAMWTLIGSSCPILHVSMEPNGGESALGGFWAWLICNAEKKSQEACFLVHNKTMANEIHECKLMVMGKYDVTLKCMSCVGLGGRGGVRMYQVWVWGVVSSDYHVTRRKMNMQWS